MEPSSSTQNGLFILAQGNQHTDDSSGIDIVAVHGLNGHPFRTWTATKDDGTAVLWLRDFLPSRIPEARIMTFGFDAKFFGLSISNVDDDAKDLLSRLTALRNKQGRQSTKPIMFIAHSLGGIVVKQALVFANNYPEFGSILTHTRGVVFLGTPHRGSEVITPALTLSRMMRAVGFHTATHRLESLQIHSDTLFRITDLFRHLTTDIRIVSFYETMITAQIRSMVVERDSALMGVARERCIPLRANHRDICRFANADDERLFGIVWPELSRLAIESMSKQRKHSQGTSILQDPLDRHFFVPIAQNTMFSGRESILALIEQRFDTEEDVQKRVILTGLGGVGKTQIAAAFAYKMFSSKVFSTIFWSFAASREKLLQSFTDIAKHLGLYNASGATSGGDGVSDDTAAFRHVEAVKTWLSSATNVDWLLIFDNVDDLESFDLREFFPNTSSGHILITSRRQNACRFGHQIEIDVMSDADAANLLIHCSRSSRTHNLEEARILAKMLGNLPLALDQAGAYIAEQDIDLETYTQLFKSTQAGVLAHKPPKSVWSYEQTVFSTWEISYAKMTAILPVATQILDIAAFFGSDDIPLELLLNLARDPPENAGLFLLSFIDSITSRRDYEEIFGALPVELVESEAAILQAIGKLASFSMVKRKSTRSLYMHPMVHTWLRGRHQRLGQQENFAQLAISLAHRALFNAADLARFGEVQQIYPHCFTCNTHFETIPSLVNWVDIHRLGACIIALDAWVPLSNDQGTLQKSDRFFQFISKHQIQGSWCIPDALLTVKKIYRLNSLGRRKESAVICEDFFRKFVSRNRYGDMYQACVAQAYAPSLYRRLNFQRTEEIYALSKTEVDPSGYMTARKSLVLGSLEYDMNNLDACDQLLSSCKDILHERVGPNFFLYVVWHHYAALCYLAQGRQKEAESLVLPIINKKMSQLKKGLQKFAFEDYELAEVYSRILRAQGRFSEAIAFVQDLLATTYSKIPPPARSLAELTFILARLDEATNHYSNNTSKRVLQQDNTFQELFNEADALLKRAEEAYECEWTRGMWVFKFVHTTIDEYRQRIDTKLPLIESKAAPPISDADLSGYPQIDRDEILDEFKDELSRSKTNDMELAMVDSMSGLTLTPTRPTSTLQSLSETAVEGRKGSKVTFESIKTPGSFRDKWRRWSGKSHSVSQ